MKIYSILILTLCSLSLANTQELPDQMFISEDGRRLVLGGAPSTGLYEEEEIKTIQLEFYDNNYWDQLSEDIPAKMIYEGIVYDSVGVRFKGATSDFANNSMKKSFNISLDFVKEDQRIDGYKTLNLNGGYDDPSNLREVLFNWIGRQYNISLKSNFVYLEINGQNWGAYANVQQLNNDFIEEWFLDSEGSRWRCESPNATNGPGGGGPGGGGTGNCRGGGPGGPGGGTGMGGSWGGGPSSLNYLGADSTLYEENYTLKSTDRESPWSDLIEVIDKLNNLSDEDLANEIADYIDIDKTLWYLAHEILFTDEDGYIFKGRQDYYIFFDDYTERLTPLEYDGNSVMQPNLIDWSPFHQADDECRPLVSRILNNNEFRQRYLAHLRTILSEYTNEADISERIDLYESLIDSYEANDPVGDVLYSYNEFKSGVQTVRDFLLDRKEIIWSYSELMKEGVEILSAVHSVNGNDLVNPIAFEEVEIEADLEQGAANVFLYYGTNIMGKFNRTEMFDTNGDGKYTATIQGYPVATTIRYYVESVKDNTSKTRAYLPRGAEHEVYFYRVQADPINSTDVVINELMASNDLTVFDPAGQADDWIELYNMSNDRFDLSGYYLTDNVNRLTKWEIPEGSFIEANGYLIVWADEDGDKDQEGLHANFKLSKDGEEILLSTPDSMIVDQVFFGPQETDLAYARMPNGTGDFVIKEATFEANNDLSSSINNSTFDQSVSIYPNPATDILRLDFDAKKSQNKIMIYSSDSQLFTEFVSDGKSEINIASLARRHVFFKGIESWV